MIFDLNVVDSFGNKKVWSYDNEVNKFYDEKGICLIERLRDRFDFKKKRNRNILYYTPDHNPNRWTNDVDEIEINLGLNCNMRCEYCSQLAVRDKGYNSKPSDVPNFIKLLKDLDIKTKIISLWGGEPLVYWKTIEVLVPELRNLYGEKLIIYIVTNGTLLDEEKMKFFMKYDVRLEVSDDGNNFYRNDEEIKQKNNLYSLMNKYAADYPRSIKFNACVSKNNADVVRILNSFKSKVPNIKRARSANVVRIINDYGSEEKNRLIVQMEEKDLVTLCFSRMCEILKYYDMNPVENNSVERWFFFPKNIKNVCGCRTVYGVKFTVDMRGEVYPCHCKTNIESSYGNIKDYKTLEAKGFTHILDRKYCKVCPFVAQCGGNCPHATNSQHEISCANRYANFFGYLRGFFIKEFGLYVESIVPREKIEGFDVMNLLNGNLSNVKSN